MEKYLRLFLGIGMPSQAKILLSNIDKAFSKSDIPHLKPIRSENLHITLKYLGNTNSQLIEKVITATKKVLVISTPFNLEIGQPKKFPKSRNPRIIYADINGDLKELKTLQYRLDQTLLDLGYPLDKREYNPHLTLARLKTKRLSSVDLGELLDSLSNQLKNKIKIEIREISLFESTLQPQGSIYNSIVSIKFGPITKS